MDELLSKKIMYHNPSSKWVSAPVVVPKAGPAQWSFKVELSPMNKYTIPYQFTMPNN